MWVRSLSTLECVKVLAANRFGHLACAMDSLPYVVPIHYVYDDGKLYAFSLPGKKIDILRANPHVSMHFGEYGGEREWRSVIVDGRFEELSDRVGNNTERGHAWSLLSQYAYWWEPGALKPTPLHAPKANILFQVLIDRISGRGAQPEMPAADGNFPTASFFEE